MIYLDEDDVVCTGTSTSSNFGLGTTFKLNELLKSAILWIITVNNSCAAYSNWLKTEGVKCQVLRKDGGGWQSGKVRFRVEFVPDNPPVSPKDLNSPLADLRTNLDI